MSHNNHLIDFFEYGYRGGELIGNVDAINILINHLRDAFNLPSRN
jgi:hypothetical protein